MLKRIERYFRRGVFSRGELILFLVIYPLAFLLALTRESKLGSWIAFPLVILSTISILVILNNRGKNLDPVEARMKKMASLSGSRIAQTIAERARTRLGITTGVLLLFLCIGVMMGLSEIIRWDYLSRQPALRFIVAIGWLIASLGLLASAGYAVVNWRRLRKIDAEKNLSLDRE